MADTGCLSETGSDRRSPSLTLRLLGPFEAQLDGIPLPRLRSRKGSWLLALLVLRHDRNTERVWLAGTLWPDSAESAALANLRDTLKDLRCALGAAAGRLYAPTPRTLSLELAGTCVDLLEFDAAVASGDEPALQAAVSLYRGPLLEGWTEEWVFSERRAREEVYLGALETLAAQALARREPAAAVDCLRRAIAADALRETAHRALMQALAAEGNFAAATQIYRDLRLQLHRELNAEPDPETLALYQQLRTEARSKAGRENERAVDGIRNPGGAVSTAPFGAGSPRRVPRPLTPLIGREKELAAIEVALANARLVTLTGAGGAGKTRLAIQVAEEVAAEYTDGTCYVELAALADSRLIPQTVAQALGLPEQPGRTLEEGLEEFLGARQLLLVLDNCEHLLAACARLTERLLHRCPALRVLTTSRQPLGLFGETAWRVPSLAEPAAVRLFAERAAAVSQAFALTPDHAAVVERICRQLDGLPLAIELAAARVKALPVEKIAERLDDRFRLLRGGSRTALPRHQTLQALIDWSYELLSEAERRLLRRLSVFAGGWTLEAAEAVCVREGVEAWEVLDLLTALVEKSLVQYEEPGTHAQRGCGEARYRLLETVRQYARDRLLEASEAESVRGRHRDWCLLLAERAEPELRAAEQLVWLNRLEVEHDNLRAALEWTQSEPANGEDGLRLAGALGWFWAMHDDLSEGRAWLEGILARTAAMERTAARAKALYGAGNLAWVQGDHAAARSRLEASMTIWRELGNKEGVAHSLRSLAIVARRSGDPDAGYSLAERSVALFREGQDTWGLALALYVLGNRRRMAGHYETARSVLEESQALFRETGDQWGVSLPLRGLGHVAYWQGDYVAARLFYEESLARRTSTTRLGTIPLLVDLANANRSEGDHERAVALYKESLAEGWDLGLKGIVVQVLYNLGYVAKEHGDDERAVRLFGAAEALLETISSNLDPEERAASRRHVAAARTAMGEAAFAAAWATGRRMPLDQAIEFALETKCPSRPGSGG